MQRQYYVVPRAGSLKNLKYQSSAIPVLPEEKVLIEVKSVGLNYADIFAIMGLYSATPKGAFIPGLEFCGIVIESKSSCWVIGQRVIGVTRFGGYDSHIVADPTYLMPLPSEWNYQQGAAFPVQTLTAYYALHTLGNIGQANTVLIHSAAGGVGLQANRIAKRFNAYTIGVVGHEDKIQLLQKEGFDAWIVRGRNFRKDLNDILNGRDLQLVMETTGNQFFNESYEALAPMGRLIAYGSAQFTPSSSRPNYATVLWKYLTRPRIDPLSMIKANKSVMGFNLIWLYERNELMMKLLSEIDELKLPPPVIGHEFDFKQGAEALQLFQSGRTTGKVVLNIS